MPSGRIGQDRISMDRIVKLFGGNAKKAINIYRSKERKGDERIKNSICSGIKAVIIDNPKYMEPKYQIISTDGIYWKGNKKEDFINFLIDIV